MSEAAGWVDGRWVTVDLDHYSSPEQAEFAPDRLVDVKELTGGRGPAWAFTHNGRRYVLRHDRRGGRLAPLLEDRYLRVPLAYTRPAREWRVLQSLNDLGLPVPPPAAWRLSPVGIVFYRAEMVTGMVDNSQTLLATLAERPLEDDEWRRIAETLVQFFHAGLRHPDLNAGNILLDGQGEVHLIDFDRAKLRLPVDRVAQARMTNRLVRSLRKERHLNLGLWCAERDIEHLQRACLESIDAGGH